MKYKIGDKVYKIFKEISANHYTILELKITEVGKYNGYLLSTLDNKKNYGYWLEITIFATLEEAESNKQKLINIDKTLKEFENEKELTLFGKLKYE
jgi:hypothetical protein